MPPAKKHDTNSAAWKRSNKDSLYAIKKHDGEPLLRADISWAVLDYIFSDRTFRFLAPVDQTSPPDTAPIYLNFDQLYLEAVLSSMKTTQNLRSKLIENQTFAINFCKICLLINIGRVNTTLAFYSNMKTALRTYHPVPSLQTDETSRKDMQDAPRIKGILKACFLDWEVTDQPSNLKDIAKKRASPELKRGPPTTVVTAIFHLFTESLWASDKYFPPGFDLYDLFYPSDMPAAPRGQAFLSLLHHILESPSFLADFDTPQTQLVTLSPPIALTKTPSTVPENIDPEDELNYAREMKELREGIVKTVPAIQKREEEIVAREKKKNEKDESDAATAAAVAAGGVPAGEPAGKKQRLDRAGLGKKKSYAKHAHEKSLMMKNLHPEILPPGWQNEDWTAPVPSTSSLPLAWKKVQRDLLTNVDPDYSSDEEEAWSFDLLRRRALLTFVDPRTGKRGSVKECAEWEEWKRRGEEGWQPATAEEVEVEGKGEDGSEMGDLGDD